MDHRPKCKAIKLLNTHKKWKSTDKLEYQNFKTFESAKDAVNGMKRQATDWEVIFVLQNTYLIKDLYPDYIKNSHDWIIKTAQF